jgi:uncharacterized protein with GYD domain
MATFFIFGKYTSEAFKGLSSSRTGKAIELIKKFNGETDSMYALLGDRDLVFITQFPGFESAMKASIALSKLTGIAFTTSEAIAINEFDNLMGEV